MSEDIKPLSGTPGAFAAVESKVNEIIGRLKPLLNLEARGNVEIKKSNTNMVITGKAGGGGAGLPDGVVWEEFTICDSGTPATRWIPTSTTDPS